VSNSRHYEALTRALEAIHRVQEGMAGEVPTDLVSIDINQALFHLGEITGQISTDDLLGNIFSNFCIGK
jgi:tRNA modification GTPase